MVIIYIIIGIVLGFYWKSKSICFGYTGADATFRRGSTILFMATFWPIVPLIQLLMKRD